MCLSFHVTGDWHSKEFPTSSLSLFLRARIADQVNAVNGIIDTFQIRPIVLNLLQSC
jgi:hypothetical protein